MFIIKSNNLKPFLKWPGGKRWLISRYSSIFPTQYNHYYEPFVGGGSVYFDLKPLRATIADKNEELINLYSVMRDNPSELKKELEVHQKKHDSEYYYKIRKYEPRNRIKRAGRLLYLNRTCFNGMYRVNKKGKFNVPIGLKNDCIYDVESFGDYSNLLKDTEIVSGDFATLIKRADEKDLLFVDPPYTVSNKQNSFIKYNEELFTWDDQKRLLEELISARNRGVFIIATNAYYNELVEMYKDNDFYVNKVNRYSSLASKTSERRMTQELLITSFPVVV